MAVKKEDVLAYLENANMMEVSELISEIEEKSEICPVDFPANKLVMSKKVEKLVTFDFNVVKEAEEILVEDWFLERLNLIEELSKKEVVALTAYLQRLGTDINKKQ